MNTLINYLAKANMKLGGLNWCVSTENAQVTTELTSTLFIAIRTSGWGPKSLVDRVRNANEYENPGVLGFAANYSRHFNEFLGNNYNR